MIPWNSIIGIMELVLYNRDILGYILQYVNLPDLKKCLTINKKFLLIVGKSEIWYNFCNDEFLRDLSKKNVDFKEICQFLENNSIFPNTLKIQKYYGNPYYRFIFYSIFKFKHVSLFKLLRSKRSDLENFLLLIFNIYDQDKNKIAYKKCVNFIKYIRDIRIDLEHIPNVFLTNIYLQFDNLFEYIIINVNNNSNNTKIVSRIGLVMANVANEKFSVTNDILMNVSLSNLGSSIYNPSPSASPNDSNFTSPSSSLSDLNEFQTKYLLKLPIPWAYTPYDQNYTYCFSLPGQKQSRTESILLDPLRNNVIDIAANNTMFNKFEIHHISNYEELGGSSYSNNYGNIGHFSKYYDLKYRYVCRYFILLKNRLDLNFEAIEIYDFITYVLKILNYYL